MTATTLLCHRMFKTPLECNETIIRLRLPNVKASFQSSVVLNLNQEGCKAVGLIDRLQSYVTFFSLYISFLLYIAY